MEQKLLEIEHLSVSFSRYGRGFKQTDLPVISDLNLTVGPGELVAVAGSSGSGKSLLASAVMGILPRNARMGGGIKFQGEELTPEHIKKLRGSEIVLVPQSVSFLDPLMKVGLQVRKGKKDGTSRKKSAAALERYGLGRETENLYPFELSGGMTRRVLISTAVLEKPRLVIADEPTPGLHEEAARRVLGHFREIAEEGAGVLLITHDLELALEVADRVAVFYAGTTVEEALASDFEREENLRHPYTKALYRAMPQHGFRSVPGVQPYVTDRPEGCPYAPRCAQASARCAGSVDCRELRGGLVKCIHAV